MLLFSSCTEPNQKLKVLEQNSPYKLFFNELRLSNITDTVLVQNTTKIFGCGTASMDYNEELRKTGLDKYYDKYGTVLSDLKGLSEFEKNNKVKILCIERGTEGELFQLEDSLPHKNTKLEKRLLEEKSFISFDEEPEGIDAVKITVVINRRATNKIRLNTYHLLQSNKIWTIASKSEEEVISD